MHTLYFCPVSSSSFFPSPISAVANWMSAILLRPSANLECRSEMWCTAYGSLEMQDTKKSAKICHQRTIAQLCWALSLQLRHILIIGKKLVKQQCLPHMSSQYGELPPTNGWELLASLGHPNKFQWVSHLGSITAWHSSSGRQPNFEVLNRGCYLYLGGWPSCWTLAHILVAVWKKTVI